MRARNFYFTAGRYSVSLNTDISSVSRYISRLYSTNSAPAFVDLHISVLGRRSISSLFSKQACFSFCDREFFLPLEYRHAFPLLEWGLNWCITNHFNNFIYIHAAVLEYKGRAIILPGAPGAGKSTLCAALAYREGWRLLSDELTLYNAKSSSVYPNPRPVALKDRSIDIIQKRYPELKFTAAIKDTHKGTIAYLRPPSTAIEAIDKDVTPRLVVFPKFTSSSSLTIAPVHPAHAMMRLGEQTFNYGILGGEAFAGLNQLSRQCDSYELEYDGDLDQAILQIENLMQ